MDWRVSDLSFRAGRSGWRMSGKEPLKKLLRKRLGNHLVNRPKQAFNPPLEGRLRRLGPGVLRSMLLGGSLQGILDESILRRLIDDHFNRTVDNTYRLWQLLYLAFWVEQRRLPLK